MDAISFLLVLFGPDRISSSPDMVNFDESETLHILTLTSVTFIMV